MPKKNKTDFLGFECRSHIPNKIKPKTKLGQTLITPRCAYFWLDGLFSLDLFVRHLDFVKFVPSTDFC